MSTKKECSICMEVIKIKNYYTCDHCKTYICKTCLKDCIITYGNNIPKCPECKISISFEYLAKLYSKKFIKEDLLNHITNIQFNVFVKEKSKLITETLILLCMNKEDHERIRKSKLLHDKYINILNQPYYKKYCSDEEMKTTKYLTPYFEEIISKVCNDIKNNDVKNLDQELDLIVSLYLISNSTTRNQIIDKYYLPLIGNDYKTNTLISYNDYGLKQSISKELNSKTNNKNNYLLRCSTCEIGFITTEYKCIKCKKQLCDKCLIELTDEHICKQEDIDNLKFILSETKPCPNCFTRISKISGCDQMFCTFCHKGFDWKTGKIITSNFHNPHRMEWLRNGGIDNLNDDLCAGNYVFQIISKHPVPIQLTKLLYYKNYCSDIVRKYTNKLNSITDKKNELMDLAKYLYWDYTNKHKPEVIQKRLTLTENQFKRRIKTNEHSKIKYMLYIETYQNILDLCATVLIQIDQILLTNSYYKHDVLTLDKLIKGFNSRNNLSIQRLQENSEYFDYYENGKYKNDIKINNDGMFMYKKEYLNKIYDNIMNIPEISSMLNNCIKLLKEIENTRINELEKYLDMNFERFVYDELSDYNVYSWTTKYGFDSLQDIIKWHNILIEKDYKQLTYEAINNISKERKIYKQIKYIEHIFTLPNYAYSNVYKLPISYDEKIIAYFILKPK